MCFMVRSFGYAPFLLMSKVCCGFGHRQVFQNIDEELDKAIRYCINDGCRIFYTGDMGDFDRKFASTVRRYKHKYDDIKLILVCPYLTKKLQVYKEYYEEMYDDIIIPTELADIHYKQIITKRNQWIIDNSDYVISYTFRDYGGAYNAYKYATKQKKSIIKITL